MICHGSELCFVGYIGNGYSALPTGGSGFQLLNALVKG